MLPRKRVDPSIKRILRSLKGKNVADVSNAIGRRCPSYDRYRRLLPSFLSTHHWVYSSCNLEAYPKRTFWIRQHLWFGRALVILGAINGGLGLQLSSNTIKGEMAYCVIAGVVYLTWFVVAVVGAVRDRGTKEGGIGKMVKLSQKENPDRSTEEVIGAVGA